jgi:NIPSNAP protein
VRHYLIGILFVLLSAVVYAMASQKRDSQSPLRSGRVEHLKNFQVIELRRYTIKEGERNRFARYFESYFPEAFEQLGSIIFGHFLERKNRDVFTWIRGFHDMDERKAVNQAFYSGPLWKEHSSTMNDRLLDHTNVLLLQPLNPDRGIAVLPAVDPVNEERGAQGVVAAQIFPVKTGNVEAFAGKAEEAFDGYRATGAREAGVLVTLDAPNNFPGLPFRTDGPYLVWLGILRDGVTLEKQFTPLAERASATLSATGLLRDVPELVILDPASRSRLRWLP